MNIRSGASTEQLSLLGVCITLGVLVLLAVFVDIESLRTTVVNAGPLAPLVFIVLKASTIIIAPLSGAPLYPLVGLLFGFWPGLLYVLIGDFIGYTAAFWIARTWGYPFVHNMIASKEHGLLARIVDHVGTNRGFLHLCATCFALPELVSYGAGLSKLPYRVFILFLPFSALMSAGFVFLGSLLDFSKGSLLLTIGIPLLGGFVVLAGVALFLRGVRRSD